MRYSACRYPLILAFFWLLPAVCYSAVEVKHRFLIDAAPLSTALVQFVSQSGVGVVVAETVDTGQVVSAVSGELAIDEALQQMLSQLPLEAEQTAAGYYLIRQLEAAPEPVENGPLLEELVVTGTYIKGGLGSSLNPLRVVNRAEMAAIGSPSMIDLIATLPTISGTENQSNQFHNVSAAGTANVNLRGLGVSRTLVLLNGKRLVPSALPHNDGQAFVDINSLPAMALEQVDILKDGAGANYGSDAVAGVVNFITRRDFRGVELHASGKYLDEGDGDWDMGLLAGSDWGGGHWLGAVSYSRRGELTNRSRQQIIEPRVDIPELQRIVYGVSSLGNPGAFIPINATTAAGGVTDAEVAAAAQGRDNYVGDPNCEAVGGVLFDDARCGFNYVQFDNLVEQEERWQAFSAWRVPIGSDAELYAEFNYSYLELADWKTSPSFPPVNEADAARYIPIDHPGLVDFLADNPVLVENDGDIADFSGGAVFVGRPIGVTGPAESGWRAHQTARLLAGVNGSFDSDAQYDLSFTYATNLAESRSPDALIDRWENALQGFGGPNCSGVAAGQNGCLYYNPFSSAIAGSPDYNPALANPAPLLNWLKADLVQQNTSELLVADGLVTGSFDFWGRMPVDYAYGFQYRQETLKIRFNDLADVEATPGVVDVPGELPGAFIFFRGGREDDVSQDVAALFGELAIQLDDNLLMQLALRYEDYGGAIGHSLDPKLALRWDVLPQLTLRSSVSTTFRAPSLNQTSLDTTSLELIGAAFAFKAVDRIGDPELEPEQAISANLGVIWHPNDHWRINLDYWRVDFSDVIVQQSANAIVNTVLADPTSPLASQVVFDGSGNISRILSRYVNGPDILVDGLDFSGEFSTSGFNGRLSLGWELAYLRRYDVGVTDLQPAFAADGRLNTGTFVKSLPNWRGSLYLNYQRQWANVRLVVNGIGSYKDDGLAILAQTEFEALVTEREVSAFYSLDAHLGFQLPTDNTNLGISIVNLTDRAPPSVREDMRFDTTQHNAFGRTLKLSLRHQF